MYIHVYAYNIHSIQRISYGKTGYSQMKWERFFFFFCTETILPSVMVVCVIILLQKCCQVPALVMNLYCLIFPQNEKFTGFICKWGYIQVYSGSQHWLTTLWHSTCQNNEVTGPNLLFLLVECSSVVNKCWLTR